MKREYFLAPISIFLWSTVATITKLLLGDHNSIQLLWVSSLLAGIFLLVVNLASGKMKLLKTYRAKDFVISVLIGLPGTFFYYMFYYAGAD